MKEILRVLAGSRGYGIGREDSDWDYVSIMIPTLEEMVSIYFKPGDVVHNKSAGEDILEVDFVAFAKQVMDGNPFYISYLWCPVEVSTPEGDYLIGKRDNMVSRLVVSVGKAMAVRSMLPFVNLGDTRQLLIGSTISLSLATGLNPFPLVRSEYEDRKEATRLARDLLVKLDGVDCVGELSKGYMDSLYFSLVMGSEASDELD